jgi:tRNA (guanine-N7-)-methyltransferase
MTDPIFSSPNSRAATAAAVMERFVSVKDICQRLDWGAIFPKEQPVHVDLGAGDGGFALELAQKNPDINVLAVERLLGRARKIARRSYRAGLSNLRVLRLESAYTVAWLLPLASVSVLHVMHPDPWPKKKHAKNRLFQPEFIASCARALVRGGELRVTLDHADYYGEICERIERSGLFERKFWEPDADYPQSDFQKEFAAQGTSVFRSCWVLR